MGIIDIQKAVKNTGQSVVEATFTTMGGVFAGVIISLYRTQFVGLRNFFGLIITLILFSLLMACLLYTSDAADDSLRVDLGCCRIV